MKNMNIENHDGHIWKQVEYLTFKHHRAEKKLWPSHHWESGG